VLGTRFRDHAGTAIGKIAELLRRQPQITRDDGGAIGVARRSHLKKQ
jgi:hypothetical protein